MRGFLGCFSRAQAARFGMGAPLFGSVAMALGGLTLATPAMADIARVEPYHAVVTRNNVEMKAGDSAALYPVRQLKSGTLVRVDGEGPGWVRVEYLPGMRAYVKAEEVTLGADGKTARLVKSSRLNAANIASSERAHWWYLLDKDMAPGATLVVLDEQKSADGKVHGYFVQAPAEARGFIKQEFIRRATPEEIAAATGVAVPSPAPSPAPSPSPVPEARPTPSPPPTAPAPTPATPGAAIPATPAEAVVVAPVVPPPLPLPPPKVDVATLRSLFESVQRQPVAEAELDSAIGEFRRRIDTLSEDPDDAHLRRGLEQRLQVLEGRKRVQDRLREEQARTQQIRDRAAGLTRDRDEIEKNPLYTMVGRLLPSTVYDGKRLPLMYRVESADTGMIRTVGYMMPTEGLDPLAGVGRVVGVVGEARYDEALRVNVVAATRLDVLGSRRVGDAQSVTTIIAVPQAPAPAPQRPPGSGATVVPVRPIIEIEETAPIVPDDGDDDLGSEK